MSSRDEPHPVGWFRRGTLLACFGLVVCLGQPARSESITGATGGGGVTNVVTVAPAPLAVPGQLLVRFRGGVAAGRRAGVLAEARVAARAVRGLGSRRAVQAVRVAPLRDSVFDQLVVVELANPADAAGALIRLRRHPDVRYAEPNSILQIVQTAGVVPNDFDFDQQWSFQNTGQDGGTPGADIHAPGAWAVTTGNRAVKVAVIDTGIDYFHPDLAANLWVNPGEVEGNGVDDDGNGYIDDLHGYDFVNDDSDPMDDNMHGTHVSGIIGGVGNNGLGVAGVCWQVSLMALKAFDQDGNGSLDQVIAAIHYAVANGARVINASWGTPDVSQSLEEAVAEAHAAGLVVVAAAGNNQTANLPFPAAYAQVVSVGALDNQDHRAFFSNYGPGVTVAAPGVNIYSTAPGNRFQVLSGTSMAAPHVSGVAALILSRHPEFTNVEVETILRNAVDPVVPDQPLGAGRINAAQAVAVDTPLPQARLQVPAVLYGKVDVAGTAAGTNFAGYTLEYGPGLYPTNWTPIGNGTTRVTNDVLLAGFSTAVLQDAQYTIRLSVQDVFGQRALDRAVVNVQNTHLAAPLNNDVLRAGDPIGIQGTVFGSNRTYTIEHGVGWAPSAWSSAGVTLMHGGTQQVLAGLLGVWNTTTVATNEFYSLRLVALAAGQPVETNLARLIYLDGQLRPGWPQYLPMAGDYPTNDWRQLVVADLDGDGRKELVRVDPGPAAGNPSQLLVFDNDGSIRWSRALGNGAPVFDLPVVGDVDGDGRLEIFADTGTPGMCFAFRADGRPLGGQWPVPLEAGGLAKVIADLRGDGQLELIGLSQETVPRGSQDYRQLVVFDAVGNLLRKWEFPACAVAVDAPRQFPAVGRLLNGPGLQIVAVTGCNQLSAFSLDQPDGSIWTATVPGNLFGSPVIGDVNGDGQNEVVIGSSDPGPASNSGIQGGVYVFDRTGVPLPGWPVLVGESFASTPALADLDADGAADIVVVDWDKQLLHVLRYDGFELGGWPVGPVTSVSVKSNPVIGDVDGDGWPDVVMATPGKEMAAMLTGSVSLLGGVKAWNALGQEIDLNPRADQTVLNMEASGGAWLKAGPVALADLDGHGRLSVVATTVNDAAFSPDEPRSVLKQRYSLYVWDLDITNNPARMIWPAFQHDPQHTGYLPSVVVDQAPVVTAIPDQTIQVGNMFQPIELDHFVADPDNTPDQIRWTVKGNQNLQVTISPQRVLQVIPPAPDWTGQETLVFTATDPAGMTGAAAAMFAVLLHYAPPLANDDLVTTPGGTPAEFAPLANDVSPQGLPLQLVGFSFPLHGKVTRSGAEDLVYTPAKYFSGTDSFTYTVSDGQGGIAIGHVTLVVTPVAYPPVANPDTAITLENTPVVIDVLTNDLDPNGGALSLVSVGTATNGTATIRPDATVLYKPAVNFTGLDGFTYQIANVLGSSATGSVQVLVKPVAAPPVMSDQAIVMNRNTQRDIVFLGTDPQGWPLTFTIVTGPDHGALFAYPTIATYIPQKGYAGADNFTYVANDGVFDSATANVAITVLAVNNPPVAVDQQVVAHVGRPRLIQLDVTDADDDPVQTRLLSQPVHGTLFGAGTNYTYTPVPGYLGGDVFTYVANDGQADSAMATVTITVTDQNTAPIALDAWLTCAPNVPTNFTAQASDLEGDPLTYIIVTPPRNGMLSGTAPNFTYTPNPDYLGPDRFTFKVNDGALDSGIATVTITVAPADHPPVAARQIVTVVAGTRTPVPLAVQDADGNPLRCAILDGPQNGRLFGLGTSYVYVPNPGFTGSDSFTYEAWDGYAFSNAAVVTLNVVPPSPPVRPVFQGIVPLSDGSLRLVLSLQPGTVVTVQSSTNLVDWATVSTLTPSDGTVVLTNAPGQRAVFYRAVQGQ
ncbi:MAG: Ig-like domain-containing protein [Verrucomicrobiota bacterium]